MYILCRDEHGISERGEGVERKLRSATHCMNTVIMCSL